MANEMKKVSSEASGEETPQTGCTGGNAPPAPTESAGDGANSSNSKPKSEKELKKEAEKKAKLDKLAAKKAKLEADAVATKDKQKEKKVPEKKEKLTIVYDKETKKGEKKDISGPLPDSYSPQYVEAAWYDWWQQSGFFKPEINHSDLETENPKGKFMMVIPPPNVTGTLHLGHALATSIQDTVTRWNRMKGRTTLWSPGCDHAGIATQVVVEKTLMRDENKTRHDLGREVFVNRIHEWKKQKGTRIYEQFRLLGASVDWDRETFTMDPKMTKAVIEAFCLMHERGLIYRSNRLVNWSCTLKSAISDIEVDKMELAGRTMLPVPGYKEKIEFGVIVSFAYKIEGTDEEIVVATTRIETMLGDTAIAVHPNDDRYKKYHGKYAVHPFVNRKIPIVVDNFVEMGFGTGAVKITPAHDPNDYDVGKRCNLPFISIFDDEGYVTDGCGKFSGMKRFQARKEVLKELEALGLYRETKENPMVVPICSRSKDVIEPMLKVQWYVNCEKMAAKAVKSVRDGDLRLIPESHNKTWFQWLENIKDWCISRQLWWGHRIPAYLVSINGQDLTLVSDDKKWVAGRTEAEARTKAAKVFGVSESDITLSQDEDVLDTWFSAGLFPFAVHGWPDQTVDLKTFYPGNLLETGYDIIFFWVARMVMMGQELMGALPFADVYLHSIVRDAHGRKMSKSLGNIIDPVHVITGMTLEGLHQMLLEGNLDLKEVEKATAGQKADFPQGIPECGTDALRFALLSYLGQGRDINLDIKRIEGYRFFCNKIWNAIKLSMMYITDSFRPVHGDSYTGKETPLDLWMLSRLSYAIDQCSDGFNKYDFPAITTATYNLWLYELCDIYLESIKPVMQGTDEEAKESVRQTLYSVISVGLRLLHPVMPYITEELFQRLPRRPNCTKPSISIVSYPESSNVQFKRNDQMEQDLTFAQMAVKNIRSLRAEYNLGKTKVKVSIKCTNEETMKRLRPFLKSIQVLTLSNELDEISSHPDGSAICPISDSCECYIHLKGVIDIAKEIERLTGKKTKMEGPINKLKEAVAASDYLTKVPEDVRSANEEKLSSLESEMNKLDEAIQGIKSICLS